MQASIIFCLFSLVNCKYIDNNLITYNNYYVELLKENCGEKYLHPRKILIAFDNLPSPQIGVCISNGVDFRIYFDKKYWLLSKNSERYQLFMHEASHCYLGIDHSPDEYNYMYYAQEHYLSEDIVYKQVINDIKKSCNKQ